MADDINKKIREIEARISKLSLQERTYYEDQLKYLQLNNAELGKFEKLFRDVVNAADGLNNELDGIARSFRASVAELSKQNKELNNAKSSLNSISKIATELVYENSQGVLIEDKTLDKLAKKAKLQFQSLQIAIDSGKIQGDELKEAAEASKEKERFFDALKGIREEQLKIKKDSGIRIFTGLESLTNAIPGLSKFSTAFQDASKASQETAIFNQKLFGSTKGLTKAEIESLETGKGINDELRIRLGLVERNGKLTKKSQKQAEAIAEAAKGSMSPITAGIKSLGPALSKALGPLVLLKMLVDAFKASDTSTSNIAKNLNMSYSDALGMKQELTAAANSSGDLFVTSKGMSDSLVAINNELGTSVMLNKENLATFTKLRESAGMTNEELMGMNSLVNATGGDFEKMTQEFLGQAAITAKNNKVVLNEKKLLGEINKLSAATTLSLGKQPHALSKAVSTAKALGMEMSKIENIADSLLNFEDSISAEMEAELITGKQLNLERARLAAINNDVATVAEEIASQIGSAADFSNRNRIQQEAIAKAVGMNREELANTLFIQEQLRGVTKEEAKLRETEINKLIKDGMSVEEASLAVGKEKYEDLKNQAGMQDRFNASVEKLQEIFASIAESMMPVLDIFTNILSLVGYMVKPIGWVFDKMSALGPVLGGIVAFLSAAAIAAFMLTTSLSGGLAAAGILAAIGGGMTLYKTYLKPAGDLDSPAKGKTVVSTKEGGLFELSKNDDLVAAPGLSKTLSNMEGSYKSSPSPNVSLNIEPLIKEIQTMKEILVQILNKEGTITLNGTKMGTAMAVGTYKIQ